MIASACQQSIVSQPHQNCTAVLLLNVTFPCKCLMNETIWERDSLVNHIGNDELPNAKTILN